MNAGRLVVLAPDAPPAAAPKGLARLREDDWAVAVVAVEPRQLITVGHQAAVHDWLAAPRGGFLADPSWADDGTLAVEWYDRQHRIGRLATVGVAPPTVPRPLGQAGHHRSYPCVVRHGDRRFLVCEEAAVPGVVLHEITDHGLVAGPELVSDLPALDPTVAQLAGRWWMWCADRRDGPYSARSRVYSADQLAGPWELVAVLEAAAPTLRPAGPPFEVDGAVYRPVQDCRGGYGRRVIVRRVWPDPADYREAEVAALAIEGGPRPDGIHTLAVHPDGTRAAIDAKRLRWSAASAGRAVTSRLGGGRRP